MKKIAIVLLTGFLAVQLQAAEWMTDLSKAQVKAKAEKKMILVNFTGSDWCGWCIKLSKEVFSKPEFATYAKTNLVLVELDFPRKKQQPAALKAANKALAQKYKIEGFPTIIVFNSLGQPLGKMGYMEGGPKAFTGALDKLKAKVKSK